MIEAILAHLTLPTEAPLSPVQDSLYRLYDDGTVEPTDKWSR